jgi:uncharacterized membrane protein
MPYSYGGIVIGILMMILIVLLAYLLIQNPRLRENEMPPNETPMDVLKKHYAKGEVNFHGLKRVAFATTGFACPPLADNFIYGFYP